MIKSKCNIIMNYNVEWYILLKCAICEMDDEVEELIKNNAINWGELIEQAMRHKLLPMLSHYLTNEKIFDYLPPFINQYFGLIYTINKHKVDLHFKEAKELQNIFEENSINFAFTKGIILENNLYENRGYRFMSDIDLLLNPKDQEKVIQLLKQNNYFVGTVDWKNNQFIPMPRDKYLLYISTKDKLPEYIKKIDDEFFKSISIGLDMHFTWNNSNWQIDMHKALNNINKNENGLYVMNDIYHFLYIILHLYRHAHLKTLLKYNNDVNIVKFADVYLYWNKNKLNMKNISNIIKLLNIVEPVMWVLYNTDIVFGSKICDEIDIDISKQIKSWSKEFNIMDRLYTKDRRTLVEVINYE